MRESPDTSLNWVILTTARLPCSPVKHPSTALMARTATESLNQATWSAKIPCIRLRHAHTSTS
jgi:hypothetical protein